MSSDEEGSQRNREKFTAERSRSAPEVADASAFNTDFFGPVLPPHLIKKDEREQRIYGPLLPEHLSKEETSLELEEPSDGKSEAVIGPDIPEHLKHCQSKTFADGDDEVNDDYVDETVVGPSASLMETGNTTHYQPLKRNKLNEDNPNRTTVKREPWMLELPETKQASLGLGPRQFKTRITTDKDNDRSVWTDTPADKEKKRDGAQEREHKKLLKMKRLKERDKEMEKLARKAAKKLRKKESLLEMHVKKIKKKAEKEAKREKKESKPIPERRPFDRNIDLQVHRFDESQKRAILNKARLLNDRFASGEKNFNTDKIRIVQKRMSKKIKIENPAKVAMIHDKNCLKMQTKKGFKKTGSYKSSNKY